VKPSQVVLGEPVNIYGSLTDFFGNGLTDREVEITVSPPEGTEEKFAVTTDLNGDYALYFTATSAGAGWGATASWSGDRTHEGATSMSVSFDVLPADMKLSIASSADVIFSIGTVDITGRLEATAQIPPQSNLLSGQEIYL